MRAWTVIALLALAACKKESNAREITADGMTARVRSPAKPTDGKFMTVQNTGARALALNGTCYAEYVAPGEMVVCEVPNMGWPPPDLQAPKGEFAPIPVSDVAVEPGRDGGQVRLHAVLRNTFPEAREVSIHATLETAKRSIAGGSADRRPVVRLLYPGEEVVADLEIAVTTTEGLHANVVAYGRKSGAVRGEAKATIASYGLPAPLYGGTLTNAGAEPLYPWAALAFRDKTGRIIGAAPCGAGRDDVKPLAPGATMPCTIAANAPEGWTAVEVRRVRAFAEIVMPREQLEMP